MKTPSVMETQGSAPQPRPSVGLTSSGQSELATAPLVTKGAGAEVRRSCPEPPPQL